MLYYIYKYTSIEIKPELQKKVLKFGYRINYKYEGMLEIKPELQKNILKFGYTINYKYEGMLAHSFDRFDVVTKCVLATMDD